MRLAILVAAGLVQACGPVPGGQAQVAPSAAPGPAAVTGTLLVGNKGENSLSFVDLATGRELARAETGRIRYESGYNVRQRSDQAIRNANRIVPRSCDTFNA